MAMESTSVLRNRKPGDSFGDLLRWARAELGAGIPKSGLDAELLLAAAAQCSRSAVIAYPERVLAAPARRRFEAWIRRRGDGEPLSYLTGRRDFHELELRVTSDVLVPRPETELLVDAVLANFAQHDRGAVLDLGTGSGAIALALKSQRPNLDVTAVDSSPVALRVAELNASRLGLAVEFVESDWFDALGGRRFDGIVCNPPYVRSGDRHFAGPLRHEPREALDGGADGLDAYRAILDRVRDHLTDGARLLFEHGYDQRDPLIELARSRGFEPIAQARDLGGLPRMMVLQDAGRDR